MGVVEGGRRISDPSGRHRTRRFSVAMGNVDSEEESWNDDVDQDEVALSCYIYAHCDVVDARRPKRLDGEGKNEQYFVCLFPLIDDEVGGSVVRGRDVETDSAGDGRSGREGQRHLLTGSRKRLPSASAKLREVGRSCRGSASNR